jgi:hypothetical protein
MKYKNEEFIENNRKEEIVEVKEFYVQSRVFRNEFPTGRLGMMSLTSCKEGRLSAPKQVS